MQKITFKSILFFIFIFILLILIYLFYDFFSRFCPSGWTLKIILLLIGFTVTIIPSILLHIKKQEKNETLVHHSFDINLAMAFK